MAAQRNNPAIAQRNREQLRRRRRSLEIRGFWIGFAQGLLLGVLIFPLVAFLLYKWIDSFLESLKE